MLRSPSPLIALTLAASLSNLGFAQNAQQTAQDAASALPTLHTTSRLVVVDIVATDANHKPVHNLKQEDFALLENNTSETIKTFEEHSQLTQAPEKIEPQPKLPPGSFTNFTAARANGPVNIILLDRLNTDLRDQGRLRTQLITFLKKVKPGTRVAIFGLSTKLTQLQGFTTDPSLLLAALDKKSAKTSPLLGGATATGDTPDLHQESSFNGDAVASAAANDAPGQAAAVVQALMDLAQFETLVSSQEIRNRVLYTLDAMNDLARYLVEIPGRKNVIWFSGSFPLNVMPDSNSPNPDQPFMNQLDMNADFHETVSLLSRAQVAVYPVDCRGVTVNPMNSASVEGDTMSDPAHPSQTVRNFQQAAKDFGDSTFEENNTMRDIAYRTGGKAFLNTNDLTEATDDAINDGANYYTIAYSPTDPHWDGSFRKIEVRLHQQGINLDYRRGYYADDPDHPPTTIQKEASGRAVAAPMHPGTNLSPMHLAMLHGGPTPNDIVFGSQVRPMSTANEDTLAPRNEGSKDLKGPFRRYSINLAIDPRGITFDTAPGDKRAAQAEFVVFVYNSGGGIVNAVGTPVNINFNHDQLLSALAHGIPFHMEVSVPVQGEYSLRIAVHDLKSDHAGAVEVPIAVVRGLPPVVAAATPAANPAAPAK